jgi:predicted nucleic acid-binding Zn ribbon protein
VSGSGEPRRLADGLEAVMRSLDAPSAGAARGVFGRWEEAVGPAVAAKVRPLKLDGEVLLVEVDEPGWATQLRYLEAELIARLAAVAGVHIERLEVRVAGATRSRGRRAGNA